LAEDEEQNVVPLTPGFDSCVEKDSAMGERLSSTAHPKGKVSSGGRGGRD